MDMAEAVSDFTHRRLDKFPFFEMRKEGQTCASSFAFASLSCLSE